MNSSYILHFFNRKKTGKRHNLNLRKQNKIPSIIYKKSISCPVFFEKTQISNLIKIFYSNVKLINAELNDEKFFVIIKNFLKHPYKNDILHFDFQKVNSTDTVIIDVPFNFIGEKDAIGIKQGGYLIKYMQSAKIKSSVENIPNFININLSKLDVNNSIFLTDISYNKNYIFVDLYKKDRSGLLIASIIGAKTEISKDSTKK